MGAEPRRPPIPGFDQPNVFVLRGMAEADAIAAAAGKTRRAVVVGASFIGLEVAAALRHRGLEVHVAAPEAVPLEKPMGKALGHWVRGLHEANGVVFHLGSKVLGFEGGRVGLDNGEAIEADFVVAGVGVAPRTALAEQAGLKVDNGVVVDRWLRTGAPGVYAVGDIARYPDPRADRAIRVEHWVHAERQGQHAARAILGDEAPYADAPFFWSAHYDATIRYAGHAEGFAEEVEGSLEARDAAIRYLEQGRTTAVATVGRDLEALKAEFEFEG
jgi:NADPH-dependent 2,4-dienoyl-CoA reductase/sulfur reductase-like enzyme